MKDKQRVLSSHERQNFFSWSKYSCRWTSTNFKATQSISSFHLLARKAYMKKDSKFISCFLWNGISIDYNSEYETRRKGLPWLSRQIAPCHPQRAILSPPLWDMYQAKNIDMLLHSQNWHSSTTFITERSTQEKGTNNLSCRRVAYLSLRRSKSHYGLKLIIYVHCSIGPPYWYASFFSSPADIM